MDNNLFHHLQSRHFRALLFLILVLLWVYFISLLLPFSARKSQIATKGIKFDYTDDVEIVTTVDEWKASLKEEFALQSFQGVPPVLFINASRSDEEDGVVDVTTTDISPTTSTTANQPYSSAKDLTTALNTHKAVNNSKLAENITSPASFVDNHVVHSFSNYRAFMHDNLEENMKNLNSKDGINYAADQGTPDNESNVGGKMESTHDSSQYYNSGPHLPHTLFRQADQREWGYQILEEEQDLSYYKFVRPNYNKVLTT